MTWSHPRGYDPMIACSKLWLAQTGGEVVWDKRSPQDLESYPVEQLAQSYDLIVIHHPHVGQITREGCLIPRDILERAADAAGRPRSVHGAPRQSSYGVLFVVGQSLPCMRRQRPRPDRIGRGPGSL